ncbi:hypothetical protein HN018_02210 [Lichenicola cladoniae]|uniref:Putative Flp pilus-assembly TadG-like N-terminal domain-containing protein n=1 Tax=Lichenicola cladoniae TaxID=1484109 RepID=A0A6M8HI00_9PROT|nr:pilus assembly protein TadG-related protein [Lichenicola cladoniae]NPD69192.1 hypothetical protein [Acetobacteraceae bacterium]QKE89019.1 hypothetical protein HN018_02210 [Lichenicola cladoniae]
MTPSRIMNSLQSALTVFRTAKRGAVAVMFAVMMIPMILATGAAVDFARLEILKTSLQSVVDGAALAGASALSLPTGSSSAITVATAYYNKGVASLATTATVSSPTVTIPSTIQVTVVASATLQYSFMNLVGSGLSVPITASAKGPGYQLQVTKTGGFDAQAYDGNSIYFYKVSGNTVPSSTSLKLLFTNDPAVDPDYQVDNTKPKAIQVGPNDSVGFALINKTAARQNYSPNGYGARAGSTHYFYSSLSTPSSLEYKPQPTFTTGKTKTTTTSKNGHTTSTTTCTNTAIKTTVTDYVTGIANGTKIQNCNAHPCTTLDNGVVLQNNLVVGNNNACSTPATATRTCLQLQATPLLFAWNDMGGGVDDYDYQDANYTVTCVPTSTAGTAIPQPNSVTLVD